MFRAAFSIETFASVLQNFLPLVDDCCGTFANCLDTERSLGAHSFYLFSDISDCDIHSISFSDLLLYTKINYTTRLHYYIPATSLLAHAT